MGSGKVLVVGALGQIGTELVAELRTQRGVEEVVAADIRRDEQVAKQGPFEVLDIMDKEALLSIVKRHNIDEVYQMAALLSATAEQKPAFAWQLNMEGLFNVLDLLKEGHIKKLFWPSSIAVFGPTTPRILTPQTVVAEPTTVYGISKQAGERWCAWYHNKYGADVRSIRYPGLISYKSLPGGGTTDYAVDIFYKALEEQAFECFLEANTALPMMYMPDAIKATTKIMTVSSDQIKERSSYNIGAFSFTPDDLAKLIQQHIPEFTISYAPDSRQLIANSWPASIDDSVASSDWGWKPDYSLEAMVKEMLQQLRVKKATIA